MEKGRTASRLGCDCFHFCFRGISGSSHLLIVSLPETEGSSVAHDIQTSPGTQLPDWLRVARTLPAMVLHSLISQEVGAS